jgi:hypothetical protein
MSGSGKLCACTARLADTASANNENLAFIFI